MLASYRGAEAATALHNMILLGRASDNIMFTRAEIFRPEAIRELST